MSGDFHSKGSGDLTRALWFRDSSRGEDGEEGELGYGRGLIVGVVDEVDTKTGQITEARQAFLQPRNWHLSEGDPIDPDLPNMLDRRLSVALIADDQHDYPGFSITDDEDISNPFYNDWSFEQKSTRIVDYSDPQGKTALLSQLVKVIDDAEQQYTAAIKLNRVTGNHEQAASGYVWDESLGQNGLLDTVFILNPSDAYGSGIDGTPWGILGIRTDAHFEWTTEEPDNAGGDFHGAIMFDTKDVSTYQEATSGTPLKFSMYWDPTQKDKNSGILKETGKWRPALRFPYIVPENPITDGPVSPPTATPPTGGGQLVLPPCTTPTATFPANYASICVIGSGGKNIPKVSQPDGSYTTIGGLSTGTLAGRPGTPTGVGDSYVITDKINTPNGGTGNADPTESLTVAVNDALQWAHVALLDFDQTVSARWTFNRGAGTPPFVVTQAPSTSTNVANLSAGAIGGRKVDETVAPAATGQPLVWNAGTSKWNPGSVGVAYGGTGSAGTFNNRGVIYYDSSTPALASTATPTKDQIVQADTNGIPVFATPLSLAAASGTNIAGTTLTISAGQQTGNANPGELVFKVGVKSGTGGSSVRSLQSVVKIDIVSNVVLNATGNFSSSNTAGFTYISGANGAPTGIPSQNYTGATPLYVDQSGLGLYFYDFIGSAWVAVAGGGSHALLDGSSASDTASASPTRGALIYGNSTPAWDSLALGSTGKFLGSNGTDVAWHTLAGTTNQVTVTNSSGDLTLALPQDIHNSAAPTFAQLTLSQTGATPMLSITPTWNNVGTTFDAIKVNVTDTNSAAASSFARFQVSSVDKWVVDKTGTLTTGSMDAARVATGTLAVARGGTNIGSYTTGDILYASGAGTLSKLGVGSSGNVLTVSGGIPAWAPPTGGTSFADNVFDVHDDGDATKKLVLQCSGIATGTTRTWTVQDLTGSVLISPAAASGSNQPGTDLTVWCGQGTGTGAPGKFTLQLAPPGLTGTSVNALITALTFDYLGNLKWGTGLSGTPTITGPADNDFQIFAGLNTTLNGAGRALTIRSGAGNGTGAGALMSIQGGAGGATSGNGGDFFGGGGDASTSGTGGVAELRSGASAGANQNGSTVFARGGKSTGTGTGGSFVVQVTQPGTTGSALNAFVTALTISGAGNLAVFGNGTTAASPTAFTIQATSASGSNIGGVAFSIAGSQGTGTGDGGFVLVKVAPAGLTGSSLNALVTPWGFSTGRGILGTSTSLLGFTSSTTDISGSSSPDSVLSRVAANILGIGNAQGDASGTLRVTKVQAPASTTLELGGGAATSVKIDANGNVILNSSGSALATNATNGFTYVPSSAGAPSGTPASLPTGAIPLDYDSTNNKLMGYSGAVAAWRDVGHLPKGYTQGLVPTYVSTTTISVAPGSSRDGSDAYDMSVASATTIDITVVPSGAAADTINGLDQKQVADGSTKSVATNSGNATITGTSTTFLTDWPIRSLTGTSITLTNASATVTGSGTKFLSEVYPNDLIGTNASGYYRVASIQTDTSLTLVAAYGGSTATAAGGVIEQPSFQAAAQTAQAVATITSNTNMTLAANSSATASGATAVIGVRCANLFYNVWMVYGSSGTGFLLSTQRTTLHNPPTGYTTANRRLYAPVVLDGSKNISTFYASSTGPGFWFFLWDNAFSGNHRPLAGGTAPTFTSITVAGVAPATAAKIWIGNTAVSGATPVNSTLVRENTSTGTNGSSETFAGVANVNVSTFAWLGNLGGSISYMISNTTAGNSCFIDCCGFIEASS